MLGAVLRLLAVREAGRKVGGYLSHLVKAYLIWACAGLILLGAVIFALLAIYWSLISANYSPAGASIWIALGLLVIGLLTGLAGYGVLRQEPRTTPSAKFSSKGQLPGGLSADDAAHYIEHAVGEYGPAKVVAIAALGGVVAGILSRRMPRSS